MRSFLFSVLCSMPVLLFGQANHVFINGVTSEWQTCTNKCNDEAGDGSSIDLLQVRAMNDESYLYLTIKTYEEIQLNQDNTLTLLFDTDGDASTGFQFNGIGAELKWNFGQRRGTFYKAGSSTSIKHGEIGFQALPTVTAKEFEIAILRTTKPDGSQMLFTCDSVRIAIYDAAQSGDVLPESGKFFTYYFDNTALPEIEPVSVTRSNPGFLRLMTWNMLQDGITDVTRSASFERVITAISPDIITFNEAWDTEPAAVKAILNRILPLTDGASWQAHKMVYGNITASRYPIKQSFDVVPGKRISASLIDLPDNLFNKDIVVFNCHLKCCNSDGDNETRQYEVNGLMTFINKMKAGYNSFPVDQNTPFVFMGDMNLVGTSGNLATMINGIDGLKPDWDNSVMDDDIARNVTTNIAYTYSEEGSSYWPGRLDYLLYTGSQMKLQKSFIFESKLMSAETLDQLGVYRTDNATASDHLPHIADFTIEATSGLRDNNTDRALKVYPSPASNIVYLSGYKPTEFNSYQVSDILGVVQTKGLLDVNRSEMTIDVSGFKCGVYFISLLSEKNKTQSIRIVINRF